MRDLLLSFLIGGTVVFGATESLGITDVLGGQDPTAAVRAAVPDFPKFPELPSFPETARSILPGSTNPVLTAEATPTPAGAAATARTMYVAHTGGVGVRARTACTDGAASSTGIAEGTAVLVQRAGAECPGWAFVSSGKLEFWVRMAFLDASPPKAVEPKGKAADPAPTPAKENDEPKNNNRRSKD